MSLEKAVRRALESAADPERAPGMQRYMKSSMPYLGVAAPPLRAALKPVFADPQHHLASASEWRDAVLSIWRNARHREERYAAIELCGVRKYRPHRDLDALPMFQEMIQTGAWWDYVDVLASHHVGALLVDHPVEMAEVLRAWSTHDDHWLRRTAIISQLRRKQATDLALLHDCIEPSLAEKDFFLRKAIGWALREHAKTDPAAVREYVNENRHRLSGLSQREALKNL